MTVNYKQFVRAKILKKKFHQILRSFALDLNATQIAALTDLNRSTVNRYLTLIRQSIALYCKHESPFSGEIQSDESYFGSRYVGGKRGRAAMGKTIVFSIYKRNGKVYPEIVPNVRQTMLMQIIKGKVNLASAIHTDGFRCYDGIVHLGYQKHYRILHSDDKFAEGTSHINGIEGFWGYVKVRLKHVLFTLERVRVSLQLQERKSLLFTFENY
jgi:transposase